MKLKKIASLALAGIMAVSMLAGCSNGSNSGNNENNDGNVTPVTSKIVDAVRVYLKTQNCTKRQEKDIKGFYHRQYKEVIA